MMMTILIVSCVDYIINIMMTLEHKTQCMFSTLLVFRLGFGFVPSLPRPSSMPLPQNSLSWMLDDDEMMLMIYNDNTIYIKYGLYGNHEILKQASHTVTHFFTATNYTNYYTFMYYWYIVELLSTSWWTHCHTHRVLLFSWIFASCTSCVYKTWTIRIFVKKYLPRPYFQDVCV